MPTFVLRNIDPKIWERFKARASAERLRPSTTLLRLIELYAECRIEVERPPDARELVSRCGCVFSVATGTVTERCDRHKLTAADAAADITAS